MKRKTVGILLDVKCGPIKQGTKSTSDISFPAQRRTELLLNRQLLHDLSKIPRSDVCSASDGCNMLGLGIG